MNHDIQAAWASTEIAEMLMDNQSSFFGSYGTPRGWSVYAGRETAREWPIADGVIYAENATHAPLRLALEYKRSNEGLHGILTALGQSLAYLEKGYDASVVVIPKAYVSHPNPGEHIRNIIDTTIDKPPICVYTYDTPAMSTKRPFYGKLSCVRDIVLPECKKVVAERTVGSASSFSTLWAHMREGMSHPNAFFRYCQTIKFIGASSNISVDTSILPLELCAAVSKLSATTDPLKYLSNTAGDSLSDKVWRYVWFTYYFWPDLMPLYETTNTLPYSVNAKKTKIRMMNGEYEGLFSGRSDSIKEKLIAKLNDGEITMETAWEEYAGKVRNDAHSYREVIDSGLFHIGFLQSDGTLSDLGYKFVDACERINDANTGIPLEILRAAVLINGQYDAFLHYVYQVSEEKFSVDPLAFCNITGGTQRFDQKAYKEWLYNELANTLRLIKTSSSRAGGTRNPFQSEIPLLKSLGFIKPVRKPYRIGVGIEIDWPQVQNSLVFGQTL